MRALRALAVTAVLKKLPFNSVSFEELVSSGRIYTDKSAAICRLAAEHSACFLIRPRRFGKSLLVSTIGSLFRSGIRYFKGLDAETLWKDTGEYVVITVNFSALSYSDNLDRQLDRELYREFALAAHNYGIAVPAPAPLASDGADPGYEAPSFFRSIVKNSTRRVVLLIDEYDYPLSHSLGNEAAYRKYRDYLAEFYRVVSSVTDRLRFLFITGISRFSQEALFSQFADLRDLSLRADFATLLGFTDRELCGCFDGYVAAAAQVCGLSREAVYREIRSHYGGILMHPDVTEPVCNPWSVLNFLISPEEGFCNYWYESGGFYPPLIERYLRSVSDRILTGLFSVSADLASLGEGYDFFTVPPRSLLCHTGYLAFRGRPSGDGDLGCCLTPPNLDVRSGLLYMYFIRIRGVPVPDGQIYGLKTALVNNLATRNTERLIRCFSLILSTFGCDGLAGFDDELNCRDLIWVALQLSGITSCRVATTASGRAELTADAGDTRYDIFFAVARQPGGEDLLLRKALEQAGDVRRCGDLSGITRFLRLAVVISAAEKSIVRWQLQE